MSTGSRSPILVSRSGMAMCPACMTHFRLTTRALTTTTCPFCETSLGVSSGMDPAQHGRAAHVRLRHSRSSAMLAALGVSLSLAACTQKSPEVMPSDAVAPVEPAPAQPPSMAQDMSPPVDQASELDTGTDMNRADDLGDEADQEAEAVPTRPPVESVPTPEYGAPPSKRWIDRWFNR